MRFSAALLVSVLALVVSSPALAQTPPPGPRLTSSDSTFEQGQEVTLDGAGFTPGLEGEFQINPVLGSFLVRQDGTFEATVTLPDSLAPGEHTITARTSAESATLGVVLVPPGDAALAQTGADSGALGRTGWLAVGLGAALVGGARLRRFKTA